MKMNKSKLRRRIIGVALTISLLVGIWLLGMLYKIVSYQNANAAVHTDTAIVLGAALRGNAPSPALQERLLACAALYRSGVFRHIIVSGGYDRADSQLSEAEGMRNELVKQGIPSDVIVLEPLARSTYQNLKFSEGIMKRKGWHSAVIVTHRYHAARSESIAAAIGMENFVVYGIDSKVLFIPYHVAREMLAYTKWYALKSVGLLSRA